MTELARDSQGRYAYNPEYFGKLVHLIRKKTMII